MCIIQQNRTFSYNHFIITEYPPGGPPTVHHSHHLLHCLQAESTSLTQIESTHLFNRLVVAIEKQRQSEIGTENK